MTNPNVVGFWHIAPTVEFLLYDSEPSLRGSLCGHKTLHVLGARYGPRFVPVSMPQGKRMRSGV
jgi:hypothetical protein